MKFTTSNKPLSIFAFSSLTDIVMLLLVFFLLTSQFVIQTGVKVRLPSSKVNEQSVPSKLIVTLTAEGLIYLGTEMLPVSAISGKLSIMKTESQENNLVIRADKSVPINLVIQVIDQAKIAGIDKFTLETEKDQAAP